ncbi:MAG: alpha/beta fold hydrolase [Candidatus Lokiarchaeota archaeon]|nr:alpha/beta fold hydrolase [Candidatus Lokiarchaeota archaeon]
MKIPFTNLDGKKIYYQITKADNQKAIIFIHGSGENSNIWTNQLSLEINYNLISLDLPSHNKSDIFPDLSLQLYVDAVNNMIDSLNLKSVILAGHSLGGAVAQEYYFQHPQKIIGLIFVGTGARLRVSPMILNSLKNDFQSYLDSIPVGAFYRKTKEKIIELFIEEITKTPPGVTYSDFSICDNFDELERVKKGTIKVPSLILVGKADKLTPIKYSRFFKDYINDSEMLVIDKAGHMIMTEKPLEVNKAIEEFITKRFE